MVLEGGLLCINSRRRAKRDNSQSNKIILNLGHMIVLQDFLIGSFSADVNIYMRSNKSVVFRTHFVNVNYRLF